MAVLLPVSAGAIDPAAMTAEEFTLVERNCSNAQRTLQRIQYVDPLTRVNRGSAYNTMSKLMSALTARAAYNAYSVPQLAESTAAVQDQRVQFAKDYTDYEIALKELINFDCADNPIAFYNRLVDVRAKRSIVALRIREIEQRFDIFATAMKKLETQVKANEKTNSRR